jgi:hypothetical protein
MKGIGSKRWMAPSIALAVAAGLGSSALGTVLVNEQWTHLDFSTGGTSPNGNPLWENGDNGWSVTAVGPSSDVFADINPSGGVLSVFQDGGNSASRSVGVKKSFAPTSSGSVKFPWFDILDGESLLRLYDSSGTVQKTIGFGGREDDAYIENSDTSATIWNDVYAHSTTPLYMEVAWDANTDTVTVTEKDAYHPAGRTSASLPMLFNATDIAAIGIESRTYPGFPVGTFGVRATVLQIYNDAYTNDPSKVGTATGPGGIVVNGVVPFGPGEWAKNDSGDWNTASNWGLNSIPDGLDAVATFGQAITSAQTVFTNTAVTAGTLNFNNSSGYLLGGLGSLTLSSSSSALVQVTQGTHKINLPLHVASSSTLNVASGATLLISDPVTVNSGMSVSETGAGTVTYQSTVVLQSNAAITFASSQHLPDLTVGSAATATLALGGGGARVLESDAFPTVAAGGKIDLKDNKMVFRAQDPGAWNGTAYQGPSGLIASGKLTTSMPAASTLLTTLAVATADEAGRAGTTFGQANVSSGDTLVMYTYAGDGNLDGLIDGDDYTAIDAGFSAQLVNPLSVSYHDGDFNYSGKIDADDYWLIDRNYSKQSGAFSVSAPALGPAAVPEPTSLVALGIAAAAGFARRRRCGR